MFACQMREGQPLNKPNLRVTGTPHRLTLSQLLRRRSHFGRRRPCPGLRHEAALPGPDGVSPRRDARPQRARRRCRGLALRTRPPGPPALGGRRGRSTPPHPPHCRPASLQNESRPRQESPSVRPGPFYNRLLQFLAPGRAASPRTERHRRAGLRRREGGRARPHPPRPAPIPPPAPYPRLPAGR